MCCGFSQYNIKIIICSLSICIVSLCASGAVNMYSFVRKFPCAIDSFSLIEYKWKQAGSSAQPDGVMGEQHTTKVQALVHTRPS